MKAFVTGGSSGIGYHIAKELKARGYDIVIVAKNVDKLKRAAAELGARWYSVDLGNDYRKAGNILEKEAPEVLVNNAGFGIYGELKSMDWNKVEAMLRVNVIALTYLTYVFLKISKSGRILNIASVAACRAQRKLSVYAGSKAYVEHLTKSMSKELSSEITISYLLLGPTKTNFFRRANMDTKGIEKIMLAPERVASSAVDKFLKGKKRITYGLLYKLYCAGK